MKIKQRIKSPTPPFFKKIRNWGLTVAAVGTTVLAAPVALPAVVLKVASYLAVAGTVASGISQTAVKGE
jgi:hypothetical protein